MLPHEIFSLKNGLFFIRDHVLDEKSSCAACCWARENQAILKPAKIGKNETERLDIESRGDKIAWITQYYQESQQKFFQQLKAYQIQLEKQLNIPCSKVSVQLACYEGSGKRYVRHSDVKQVYGEAIEEDVRILTLVYYLNPEWEKEHGGCLRIYSNHSNDSFDIEPLANRLVVFPSFLEHEVLPSFAKTRWALTIWLYAKEREHSVQLLPRSISGMRINQIFVSIACYRDVDVKNTINDLFQKANEPSRVFVGVCWQGDEAPPFIECDEKFGGQIRWILLSNNQACGPLVARNSIAQRLFAGEEYYLQIDAHTRFVKNWDSQLIDQLALCPSAKPILTAYPCGFKLDKKSGEAIIPENSYHPILCAERFDEDGMLRIIGRRLKNPGLEVKPIPSLFWAAGFSFSRSTAFFSEDSLPHVPFLFFGEETLMNYYFWKNGCDCFIPFGNSILFHLWTSRSMHPETRLIISGENRIKANREYKNLIKTWINREEECAKDDETAPRRTFREFETFTGINFSNKIIDERARLGGRCSWTDFRVEVELPKAALSLIDMFLQE